MAKKQKPIKKTPTGVLNWPKAAFSKVKASAAGVLTAKTLQDALDLTNKHSSVPEQIIMPDHAMDALRYAFHPGVIRLERGDWFIIGSNIYEVSQVTSHHVMAHNIETNRTTKFDRFSKSFKKVPKGGNLDMIRTLYGR